MRHSFSDGGLVRWQDRRAGGESRARARSVRLALGLAALSVMSLVGGFYAGLPVPLDLVRLLVILLIAGFAAYGAKVVFHGLIHRNRRHRRW